MSSAHLRLVSDRDPPGRAATELARLEAEVAEQFAVRLERSPWWLRWWVRRQERLALEAALERYAVRLPFLIRQDRRDAASRQESGHGA